MCINTALKYYTAFAPDVAEIINPLAAIGLIGFVYLRIYPNDSIINLANLPCWTELYYRQVFAKAYQEKHMQDHLNIHDGAKLWTLNHDNPVWQDLKNNFGYGNGITLSEHNPEFSEITMFYSKADNHAINHFYLNHLDALSQFKHYFIQKGHRLIEQSERIKDSFTHPNLFNKNLPQTENNSVISLTSELLDLLQKQKEKPSPLTWDRIFSLSMVELNQLLKKRNYPINLNTHQLNISRMELKTIIEIMKGKHAGEIALSLNIKQSTVESYVFNIKNKLCVNLKSEMVNCIINSGIIDKIMI